MASHEQKGHNTNKDHDDDDDDANADDDDDQGNGRSVKRCAKRRYGNYTP